MAQFEAFAPGVEVNGQTVLSVVEGMGTMNHGIANLGKEWDT